MTGRGQPLDTEFMAISFEPLPPDHPLFTQGVGFVFRSELPLEDEEHDDEHEQDDPEN